MYVAFVLAAEIKPHFIFSYYGRYLVSLRFNASEVRRSKGLMHYIKVLFDAAAAPRPAISFSIIPT